jgi:hypothetical protein
VTVETVTAQLLYEITGPRYPGPDVVADLSGVRLAQEGPDRVRMEGVAGHAPPPTLKVALNAPGGYRNSTTFYLTGLDAPAKAAFAERGLWDALGAGEESFERVERTWWASGREDPASNVEAVSSLTITVHDPDERKVGRAFADAAVGLALSSYPGLFGASPPGPAQEVGLYWPTTIDRDLVDHRVVSPTGVTRPPEPVCRPLVDNLDEPGVSVAGSGAVVRRPLGLVAGARSGDKGGNANLGVWARSDDAYEWLDRFLTTDTLRRLLPDVCDGREVRRYRLPTLRALNFVIVGLLGRGVAGCDRLDPQAKGLGEYLRAKHVDLPAGLL